MKQTIAGRIHMAAYYSFLGLMLQGMLVNVLLACSPAEGQNLGDVRLSIVAREVTLEHLFQLIEEKSHFKFSYIRDELPMNKRVTVVADNLTLNEILVALSNDYGLRFSQINEHLTVKLADTPPPTLGVIGGRVFDKTTGEALVGASVQVVGTALGAMSDLNGNFSIANIPLGDATLKVSFVGYKAELVKVDITERPHSGVNVALALSLVDLDEVVSTGSFREREKRELANPVTVISMETVRQTMPAVTNITDILTFNVPGYYQDTPNEFTFGANLNPVLRGTGSSSAKQLLIYIDGVPASNESFKQAASVNTALSVDGSPPNTQHQDINKLVNVNDIERIEVLRGPMATTLYGSGAGSGVINIITKKTSVSKTRLSFQTTLATLSDKYSDVTQTKNNQSLSIVGGSGQIGYNLGVSRTEREYTYTPTAIPTYRTWSLNGGAKVNLEPVLVDLRCDYLATVSGEQSVDKLWKTFKNERGWTAPDSVLPRTANANSKQDNKTLNASIIMKHIVSEKFFHSLLVGYNSYQQNMYDFTAPTATNRWNNNTSAMLKTSMRYVANFNTHLLEELRFDVTAGFEYWVSDYDNTTFSTALPYTGQLSNQQILSTPAPRKTYRKDENRGYFGEMVLGYADRLFLTSGLRIEKNSNISSNKGVTEAPKVGLSFVQQWDDVTVKPRISYGSTINPPRWDQVTGSASILPNPDLKAERNAGYEVGADVYYTDNVSLEFTYYNQTASDLILLQRLDLPPTEIRDRYTNVGKVNNHGVEVVGSVFWHPFAFNLTLSIIDNRYGSNFDSTSAGPGVKEGERVLNSPTNIVNASVTYSLPDALTLVDKQSSVSVRAYRRGPMRVQDLLTLYDTRYLRPGAPPVTSIAQIPYIDTGSYTLFNVSANYWVTEYLQVLIDVRNLFNKQVVEGQFYPIVGREAAFGVRVDI
jgi:outer membrane receptor protein involved in Fe transport